MTHRNTTAWPREFRAGAASLLALTALALPVAADDPVIGPQTRIDTNGGTDGANETSAASLEGNPNEIVGVWNDWRDSSGFSEIIKMGVGVSNNGGQTWTDFPVRPPVANQSTVEGDPMTAYDHRTGTLWVGAISFSFNGGVYVARKNPGQNTFQPSVMARATSGADKCWMAAGPAPGNPDSTMVYIAYNEGLLRSSNMGSSWSGPVFIDSGIGFLPRVGPDGTLYVAYWDFGNGVMMRRSDDGGQTFQPRKRIATRLDTWFTQDGSRFPGTFRVPAMSYLAVDPNNGTLYCVYFDTTNRPNNRANVDLYFTKSTDKGDNWTTPRVINTDNTPPGDQFFPWLEVDRAGRLHMVFHDSRHTDQPDDNINGMFDAYYAMSADGGTTWSEHRLTEASFDSNDYGLPRGDFGQFIGDYNGLGQGGDFAYPCYLSTQNGDSDIFVHSIYNRSLALGSIEPGIAGQVNTITIGNATPGATVTVGYGLNSGLTNVPGCPGLAVSIAGANVAGSAVADGSGVATINRMIPANAQGQTVHVQAVEASTCTPSNVVIQALD